MEVAAVIVERCLLAVEGTMSGEEYKRRGSPKKKIGTGGSAYKCDD